MSVFNILGTPSTYIGLGHIGSVRTEAEGIDVHSIDTTVPVPLMEGTHRVDAISGDYVLLFLCLTYGSNMSPPRQLGSCSLRGDLKIDGSIKL